ncbi:hypothetical protein DFP72DRAFT_841117 [Ephemerocybe angulata]|uniref:Uncharacterized protein n=1 Tax=Ephemerocybe angulata TaxID=980116 RepID=A0A8H6IED9_9AGAR|nr:hypothetical protein DFP72DRAFT_841117 [Tulosesus angulatus]
MSLGLGVMTLRQFIAPLLPLHPNSLLIRMTVLHLATGLLLETSTTRCSLGAGCSSVLSGGRGRPLPCSQPQQRPTQQGHAFQGPPKPSKPSALTRGKKTSALATPNPDFAVKHPNPASSGQKPLDGTPSLSSVKKKNPSHATAGPTCKEVLVEFKLDRNPGNSLCLKQVEQSHEQSHER